MARKKKDGWKRIRRLAFIGDFSFRSFLRFPKKREFLVQAQKGATVEELSKLNEKMAGSNIFNSLTAESNLFPKEIRKLKKGEMSYYGMPEIDFKKQLAILLNHDKEINKLVKVRFDVQRAFVLGQYDKMDVLLETAKKDFGLSLWWLENYLCLKYRSGKKHEEFKEFLESILHDDCNSELSC